MRHTLAVIKTTVAERVDIVYGVAATVGYVGAKVPVTQTQIANLFAGFFVKYVVLLWADLACTDQSASVNQDVRV